MKYCSKCGAQLPDDAVFCERCGNQIAPPAEYGEAAGSSGCSGSGGSVAYTGETAQIKVNPGLGIAAFVLSVIGFLTAFLIIGIFLDIAAIALGVIALILAKKKPFRRGFSVAGIVISGVSLVLYAILLLAANGLPGLPFQDIKLTDDTIPYGYGMEYGEEDQADQDSERAEATVGGQAESLEAALLDRVESEYTCKVADTNIDVNKLGTYYAEFVYLKNGEEHTKRFDIRVTDQTGPEITFLNKNSSGDVYAFLDDEESLIGNISLKDNCDGDLAASDENVKVENVIFSMEGANEATVVCSDSSGNTTEVHVNVQVIDPEVSLYDYLEHYITCDGVRFSGTSGNISFAQEDDELFDGDSLYLTDMRYVTSKSYTSGDDGAVFFRRFYFDENFVIQKVTSDHTLRRATVNSAKIAVQHEDVWDSSGYQTMTGSTLSYPAFSGLEEDPVIKELGGLRYFCGKGESDISSIRIDLRDRSVVS